VTDVERKARAVKIPLSILDLAPISKGQDAGDGIAASVLLAQHAEQHGYERVWYAEHHNMATIASSATSVLIAHVAAHTSSIRLGAGGVMLPNHSPLTIAEQFGTLASIHPGRIELGLGRAPGSDQVTMRALRRDASSSDNFPQDVLELRGYLNGQTLVPGVQAVPGKGTRVPLFILGSSLFGARLAAAIGLPFAFASHFAPASLQDAVEIYRSQFQPSDQLDRPQVIAALNVIAADTTAEADAELHLVKRARVSALYGRGGRTFTDEEADMVLESDAGRQIEQMTTYTAAGTPAEVREYLEQFRQHADADELIIAHAATTTEKRLRSVELTAEAMAPAYS
jgi:luciferase family oxidoreductase group 1